MCEDEELFPSSWITEVKGKLVIFWRNHHKEKRRAGTVDSHSMGEDQCNSMLFLGNLMRV